MLVASILMMTFASLPIRPSFDPVPSAWTVNGSATPEGSGFILGGGKASISQRFKCQPFRVTYVQADLHCDPASSQAVLRVRCLDKRGKVVLDLKEVSNTQSADPSPNIYFKTHAFTASVEVTVEKLTDQGTVKIKQVGVRDDDAARVEHKSLVKPLEMMEPFWQGNLVRNETALFLGDESGDINANLLYVPSKIISVRDFDLKMTYQEGTDYRVEGRQIVRLKGSTMPSFPTSILPKHDQGWYMVHGKHVVVTYEHQDLFPGPKPTIAEDKLPETLDKLKAGDSLTLVTCGDSITLGVGSSGRQMLPPFMPTWPELVVAALKARYASKVKLFNPALGGMTSEWGKENALATVANLKPDLVTIAFGMNDFWSLEPEAFQKNIRAIIDTVRTKRPHCEFILVASMPFDPLYSTDATFCRRMREYVTAIKGLEAKGIAVFDLDKLYRELTKVKKHQDLFVDPMHPNDYLARWYAQSIAAMLGAY